MKYNISAIKNVFFTAIVLAVPFVCQADGVNEITKTHLSNQTDIESNLLNYNASEKGCFVELLNNNLPVFTNEDYSWRMEKLNEASPVQLDFNDIVKRYIDVYSVRHRDKTAKILALSEIYFPIFEEYLDKYELPLELKYIAVIESALNPKARSRSGATGLWQFMYQASRMFDLKISSYVDERMDPVKSTEAACKYLQYLYRIFGDWQLAIAAYNGGPGIVRDAIKASGGKTNFWEIADYLPQQTRTYVPAFIAVNYVMNYNQEHNIVANKARFTYSKLSEVTVRRALSLKTVAKELQIPLADLRRLNPVYKLDFIPKSELPAKLTLPVDKALAYTEKENELYTIPRSKILYRNIERNMSLTDGKKCIVHVVKAGEFFHKIAMQYACTSNNLKRWNNLKGDILHIGQKLKVWIPVSNKTSYIGLKSLGGTRVI